jgi:hypothetical protein
VVYGSVNASLLASHADRERAVDVLRAGFAEGRLTQTEFDERVARTYASRTYGDLYELTGDLPAGPSGPSALPMGITGPLTAHPAGEMRSAASMAGLVLTAAVVFTLAALVTAMAVWLHVHGLIGHQLNGPQYGPNVPFGGVHLMPAITHWHSR